MVFDNNQNILQFFFDFNQISSIYYCVEQNKNKLGF